MIEFLISGALLSSVYALLAIGFALVFGIARVLNLAHGAFYMFGAYGVYVLNTVLGFNIWGALIISVILVAIFGSILDWILIDKNREDQMTILMLTFIAGLVAQQLIVVLVGSEPVNIQNLISGSVGIFGFTVSYQRVISGVGSIVALLLLWYFLYYTKVGAGILAIAQDRIGADHVGVPVNRLYRFISGLSAGAAALAGGLTGSYLSTYPEMGISSLIKAFSIVIVGGLGSILGTIVAAVVIGFGETAVATYFSSAWSETFVLGIVILVLFLKPQGLFGSKS